MENNVKEVVVVGVKQKRKYTRREKSPTININAGDKLSDRIWAIYTDTTHRYLKSMDTIKPLMSINREAYLIRAQLVEEAYRPIMESLEASYIKEKEHEQKRK